MKMLNVSNHKFTEDQMRDLEARGLELMELPIELKTKWGSMTPENYKDICDEVKDIAINTPEISVLHVAGFQPAIVYLLSIYPGEAVYAYSERSVVEVTQPDGSVKKESSFKHKGFFSYPRI